jgi:hypothetical protein
MFTIHPSLISINRPQRDIRLDVDELSIRGKYFPSSCIGHRPTSIIELDDRLIKASPPAKRVETRDSRWMWMMIQMVISGTMERNTECLLKNLLDS